MLGSSPPASLSSTQRSRLAVHRRRWRELAGRRWPPDRRVRRGGDRPPDRVRRELAGADVPPSRSVGGRASRDPGGVGVDGGALRPVGRLLAAQPGAVGVLRGGRPGRRDGDVGPGPLHRGGPAVRATGRGARSADPGAGDGARARRIRSGPGCRPVPGRWRPGTAGTSCTPPSSWPAARRLVRCRRWRYRRCGRASGTRWCAGPPGGCWAAPPARSSTPTSTSSRWPPRRRCRRAGRRWVTRRCSLRWHGR